MKYQIIIKPHAPVGHPLFNQSICKFVNSMDEVLILLNEKELEAQQQNSMNYLTIFIHPADKHAATINLLLNLTDRELQVAILLKEGSSNQMIAQKLFIDYHTVVEHRKKIFLKLEVHNIVEMIYVMNGLV